MNDFNNVVLSGRLTRDAELKYTNNGKPVLNFSIANNQGTKENPKVIYINCVLWGQLGETISSMTLKGTKVLLSGRLDMRQYESNGVKKQATEIVVNEIQLILNKKTDSTSANNQNNFDNQIPLLEDDLPL